MRLTDRTSLTTAALNDLMHIVDISDKTDSDEGTSKKIRIDDMGFQLYSQKGKANGYTPLNSNVKIDTQYLPSYVDDVLEFTNRAAFPTTGEAGKIYIAKDTNFCYRWSGTVYVQVGGGGSGDVETVFGRMGNIVASQGDYKTSLITNDSNVSGAYLDDALDWLNANKVPTSRTISTGLHLSGGGNLTQNRTLTLTPNVGNWIIDSQGNSRMYFGSETDDTNGVILEASNPNQQLQYRNSGNNTVFRVFDSGFVSANSGAGFSGNVTSNGFITNSIGNNANSIISNISEGSLFAQVSGTGSVNFPTGFGQAFGVRGNTAERSFFFYKPNGDNNTLYFSDYRGSQWRHQEIWHSNNSRSDSQNDARYAVMNDITSNVGNLNIRPLNTGSPTLGTRGDSPLTLGNSFGMAYTQNGNGQGSIQIQRFDGGNDTYNLNLNPLGGNVTINGNTAYHTGNIRSNSQNDARYFYRDVNVPSDNANDFREDGYVNARPWATNEPPIAHGTTFGFGENSSGFRQIHMSDVGDVAVRALNYQGTTWSPWRTLWHNGNFNPSSYVPTSRSINTGSGLSGGGNLASNRTLSVDSTVARTNVAETFSSTVTANGFYESSDIRLKDNVVPLNYGLKEIEKIDTHTWNWKSDGTEDMGVIAQELELIMPELVKKDEEGYKSVNYPKLIPVLINAIKELSNGKK